MLAPKSHIWFLNWGSLILDHHMKQFCFFNEDDLDNLPEDFKLIPFDARYLDPKPNETPKTLTSEKSTKEPSASKPVMLELSNLNLND